MMAVMSVTVLMFQPIMLVFMLMALREMKPKAKPHQSACDHELGCQGFT